MHWRWLRPPCHLPTGTARRSSPRALDLPERLETLSFTSSLRAGTSALANAARRVDVADAGGCVGCASGAPGQSAGALYGHGAAAMLVRAGGVAANPLWPTILAIEQVAADFVDHYRGSGESLRLRARRSLGARRGLRQARHGRHRRGVEERGCELQRMSHIWRCRALPMCSSACCSPRSSVRRQDPRCAACDVRRHRRCAAAAAARGCARTCAARRAHPAGWIRAGRRRAGVARRARRSRSSKRKPLETTLARGVEERATFAISRMPDCWTWISACARSATTAPRIRSRGASTAH